MSDLLSSQDAQALSQRILEQSSADDTEVRLSSVQDGNTRFADNQVTTSADTYNLEATLTARFGTRAASVDFNRFDDRSIAEASSKAETLAQLAPENDEQMPPLGQQEYEMTSAYFEGSAGVVADTRVGAAAGILQPVARAGMVAAGFVQRVARADSVANSEGLFAYHRSTLASHTVTVRTPNGDGSGWAGTTHNDWTRMEVPIVLAERAIEKAQRSVGAEGLEPSSYTVLLEPTAVGNLVRLLRGALDGRAAEEGRSFFSSLGGGTKVGEQVIDERLSLSSDPFDPLILDRPFTNEGLPIHKTTWIENGVLTNLVASRYWADRMRTTPVPAPNGLKLDGGEGSAQGLIEGIDNGLLVTRFWYIRAVQARTLVYTGLTRDGVFRIEAGRITKAVKNLRFNESIIRVLANVEAVGAPVRVVASESGGLGAPVCVPPLVVRDFRFTAVSDAV